MAKYRVLTKSYIGNAIREPGEVVEYDGEAGSALELVEEAPKAKGKAKPSPDSGEAGSALELVEEAPKAKGKAKPSPDGGEAGGEAGGDLV